MDETRYAYRCTNLTRRREKSGVVFELLVPELNVRAGEFVAIVGKSGCGKSTLLDMLGLVLAPGDADEFRLTGREGESIDLQALWKTHNENNLARIRRNHLGYVLQTGGLLPFLNVFDNIRMPVQLKGSGHTEEELTGLAERLQIREIIRKKPSYLSGGQRQRAAILRALASRPDIILADEPTAAVDETNGREIVQVFREISAEHGSAVLMVTHDVHLVKDVADRTYTLIPERVSDSHTRSTSHEMGAG